MLYDPAAAISAQHRTCYCQRSVTNAAGVVTVRRAVDGSGASLGGIATCGSAWTCPVCGLRLAARKQADVEAAMKAHIAAGGYVFLMTCTFPHERDGRELSDMMGRMADARRRMAQSKTYRRVLGKGVRTGSITALEVTWGDAHGWHPHTHTLLFVTPDAFGETREVDDGRLLSRAIDELKAAWYDALLRSGLCDPMQRSDVLARGLDIRGGQYAADYVSKFGRDAKWGLSREVSMQATKVGGGLKGAHPMQLVEWAAAGDGQAAALFREYAAAFKGRSLLQWSPGLRATLGLDEERPDDELAAAALPEEEVIAGISAEDLSALHARRMLGEFLAFIAEYCYVPETAQADVDDFMRYVREIPREASGFIRKRYHGSRGQQTYDPEKEAAHAAERV
ncbi:hypothetical protein BGV68_01855 [Burkholderia ubonensis]|uniref:protein rep n=1 Tax=Burkholderia ubonensis TaxID=101571 RepID=UPI0008FE6A44|nr:protein rep [Burkholderia ubonensis]OJA63790.1 hypothetical protein BGV68_01855 [Burkholderia ubonensis]